MSEFDTLDELRADVERALREQIEDEVEGRFRTAAVDALVAAAKVEARGPLVEARTRELLNGLARSVERRGISLDMYLSLHRPQPRAARRLAARRGCAVGRARARARGARRPAPASSSPTRRSTRSSASRSRIGRRSSSEAVAQLRESGAYERLREDLRLRAALDRLAAEVKRIPVELADAREKLWTPEKEKPDNSAKLWTPGSKEPA